MNKTQKEMDLMKLLNFKVFSYKNKEYRILSAVKMKDPTTREWFLGIRYASTSPALSGLEFVREFNDFNSKFVGK